MSEEASLISHLRGHKASVLCLETADNSILGGNVLASGSGRRSNTIEGILDSQRFYHKEDRTCRIWDLRTGKAAKAIRGLDSEVTSVCFPTKTTGLSLYVASGNKIAINDKDKYLATADDNGKVKVGASRVSLSTDHVPLRLVFCSTHPSIAVDLETHQLHKQFRTQHDNVYDFLASMIRHCVRQHFLSGGMDSHLIQWDFSRGAPTQIWDMTVSADESTTSQLFNPPFVYSIVTSNDGRVVAAGLGDGSVKVLKTQAASTGKKGGKAALAGSEWTEWRLEGGHGCAVVGISAVRSFIPTPIHRLISASTDVTLCLWDLSNHDPPSSPAVTLAADASLRKCNALAVAQQRVYVAGVGRKVGEEGVIAVYKVQW
ncbi:LOW QUALITY PROTEIN: WD40-repeat-containing domain protein [Endogone sp. FLAS-F59071]|nr:LOW QUALITY PROTEIN: WD40-repeat-containing domain protein [Endogone sp. FLAS-F59071]|eukprot:RUS18777.1 LOW QUALITY PROTEIN: WD40-repeat-containing domain protein [Endogone sp. FLAS-F59071]